jgi:hypothetical protein
MMVDFHAMIRDEAAFTLKLSKEYDKVADYIGYLEGDGWWDKRRPRFLSTFYDNRLQNTRYNTLSLLTDIRPTIDVHSRVPEYQEQANVAQNIIRYEWYNQDLDLSLVNVVDAAMLFGNAFWKIGAAVPGFMKFTACGPDMVMPIQPGMHIQDSTAVLFKTYKPVQYFKNIWPENCANLEEESVEVESYQGTTYARPPRVDEYTWGQMSPQMRSKVGLKVTSNRPPGTPFSVIELNEIWVNDPSLNESTKDVLMKNPSVPLDSHNYWYWVKPGERLYPRKRLIVFAGERLMYDGPSPYWHGLFPFSMLRMNPVMWSFWGLSKYRDLIPLNKAANEIVAGTLDMCKRALNPQAVTKEGGVPKPAWENYFPNMPGGKLRLGPGSNPMSDVGYLKPPELPGFVFQLLSQYLGPEYERMSGQIDMNKLTGKKQVPGGDTIEQMRDSQNAATRLEGRHIEVFLRDAGQIAVPNIFQHYTASRRMKFLGANGLTWEDFDYSPGSMVPEGIPPESHIKNFSMDIMPGSLLGSGKDRNKQVAIGLYKEGGTSRKAMLRTLEIPNEEIEKIEQELKAEVDAGIGPKGLGGGNKKEGGSVRMTRGQRNGNPA